MKFLMMMMSILGGWLAAEESGHARVELWLGKAQAQADGSRMIPAVLSMHYEKGWHGYWVNPGEGGVKTTLRWQLPTGVEVSELMFPVPHRAMTGGLSCYGYEGVVLMALEIRAQASVDLQTEISGELRWLACDEKSCVPGKVRLVAKLAESVDDVSKEQKILATHRSMPQPAPELRLMVREEKNEVILNLEGADDWALEGSEFFPLTEQALDPKQALQWSKTATGYEAKAIKNEYAEGPLTELKLLIVPPQPRVARWIEWKKS
jgi:DsbC/DsbD-like thiol-disulfide interchange protein